MRSTYTLAAAASLLASQSVAALDLNVDDQQSLKDAAKTIATDTMSYYKGDQVGQVGQGYYWWESGGMFGNVVRYSSVTGDHQFDDAISKAIFSQVSPTNDFMVTSLNAQLGNDDQAFWGLTAMEAAEANFAVPSGAPQDAWISAAAATFDDLMSRWNTTFCGGGIKWQFIPANNGWLYKSTIANAATMQLGARLALHTNNQTYADQAVKIYNWMEAVGFISNTFQVFDGAGDDPDNCTKIDFHEWSYNSGAMIGASAAMAKYSAAANNGQEQQWTDRATGFWKHATDNFFKNGVLYEQACEDVGTCDTDQKSFKSYLAKWAAMAGQLIPSMMSDVQDKLKSTASHLGKSCTGNGANACGAKWYDDAYSGSTDMGSEMSALEVVVGLLVANGNSQAASPSAAVSSAISSAASTAAAQSSGAVSSAAQSSSAAPTDAAQSSGLAPNAQSGAAVSATPVPTQVAAAAISNAAAAALSAGADANAVSQAVAAAQSLEASNPAAVSSIIEAVAASATNSAAVQSAVVGALNAGYASAGPAGAPAAATKVAGGAPDAAAAASSCGEVHMTVTVTSTPGVPVPDVTTPVATSKAFSTGAVVVPTGGVYGGGNGTISPPIIQGSNGAGALKVGALMLLPAIVLAL